MPHHSIAERPVEAPEPATSLPAIFLLACGVIAPLMYAATDVIAGLRWDGYSFRDQTISELNAIGSPARALANAMLLASYGFLISFGFGVWRAAAGDRRLRLAATALLAIGVKALWALTFAAMHVREADESLSDTLHIVDGAIGGLLLLVAIAAASAALGRRFAYYSIATIIVTAAFFGWSGMDGARIANDEATPWVGVKERVAVYTYQAWIAVLALVLVWRESGGTRKG